jgi:DNA processing protein
MQDETAIKYWIALKRVDGLGNLGIKALLDVFATPRRVFEAPRHMLSAVPGIGPKISQGIKSFGDWDFIEKEIDMAARQGVTIVTCHDPLFPPSLRYIYDYPAFLYVKGTLMPDDIHLAVVGSRRASTYGKFTTDKLSRELSLKGITIVSGMARGIDASAHQGALSVRGRTIAVLGSGIDIIYPPENKKLYEAIPESGALVSEYPMGTPPNGPNFPARNRIISGISLGVLVVEASDKSGSLITARIALEQGREVFAIPGSIDSAGSRGTHKLIKDGATLAEGIDDILPVILPQVSAPQAITPPPMMQGRLDLTLSVPEPQGHENHRSEINLNTKESTIFNSISDNPVHIDAIIQSSGLKPPEVLNTLLTLELQGLIRQTAGKMYVRKEGKACLIH